MALEDQTEAVFKTSRKDPVSGNDVPTGAMPEEVRDDIPAQLSEGEYVVPADVVRYYGVRFFEDLRTEAKSGWQDMEQGGRVGGEPMGMEIIDTEDDLPFDPSELKTAEDMPEGFAEGGVVDGASVYFPSFEELTNTGGYAYNEYVDDEGKTLLIPFYMGNPMSAIPTGYRPAGQKPSSAERSTDRGTSSVVADRPRPKAVNYAELSLAELTKMVDDQTKFGADDAVSIGLGLVNPILGLVFKGAMMHQAKQVERELERRLQDPNLSPEDKDAVTNLLDVAQQDRPGLFTRIMDAFKSPKEDIVPADREAVDAAVKEAMDAYTPEITTVAPTIPEPPTATSIVTPQVTTTSLMPGTGKTLDEVLGQPVQQQPKPAVPELTGKPDYAERNRRHRALRASLVAPEKTEEVVAAAQKNLATPEEIQAIRDEGARVRSVLESRGRGTTSIGFSEGGLASKKKKK